MMPAAAVRPDLLQLVRMAGSPHRAAQRLWVPVPWVQGVLSGRIKTVSLALAQRVAVEVRGDRGLDREAMWEARQKERRATEAYRDERRARDRRRQPKHDLHVCVECGSRHDTAHGLYLHSRKAHNNRKQGKNEWVTWRDP